MAMHEYPQIVPDNQANLPLDIDNLEDAEEKRLRELREEFQRLTFANKGKPPTLRDILKAYVNKATPFRPDAYEQAFGEIPGSEGEYSFQYAVDALTQSPNQKNIGETEKNVIEHSITDSEGTHVSMDAIVDPISEQPVFVKDDALVVEQFEDVKPALVENSSVEPILKPLQRHITDLPFVKAPTSSSIRSFDDILKRRLTHNHSAPAVPPPAHPIRPETTPEPISPKKIEEVVHYEAEKEGVVADESPRPETKPKPVAAKNTEKVVSDEDVLPYESPPPAPEDRAKSKELHKIAEAQEKKREGVTAQLKAILQLSQEKHEALADIAKQRGLDNASEIVDYAIGDLLSNAGNMDSEMLYAIACTRVSKRVNEEKEKISRASRPFQVRTINVFLLEEQLRLKNVEENALMISDAMRFLEDEDQDKISHILLYPTTQKESVMQTQSFTSIPSYVSKRGLRY